MTHAVNRSVARTRRSMMHNDIVQTGAESKVLHPWRGCASYDSTERLMLEAVHGQDSFSKAVAGDRAAFAELVRKHQAMVFSIALHSLRDSALAEELAQEVFLDFFNHLADLQSAAHAEFWLRRVASNRCIDYVRRRKRQPNICLEDAPELASDPVERDPFLSET